MREKSKKLLGAKGRLLEYLEFKGVKKADFYRVTNLGNGFLDKNDNIGSDNVEIIISKYGDLDLNWLITGEGEMLVKNNESFAFVEKILEKFSDVLEGHRKDHNDIICQNGKIIEQNGEVMKQNGEIIKQNSTLMLQNAEAMEVIKNLSKKLK